MTAHELPSLPEGKGPRDVVRVRVRDNHSYGTATAGTELDVEAREYIAAHRALELVSDEPPAPPCSVLRAIPTERARELGLPVPPKATALTTYEVMLWPENAEALGLRRREELGDGVPTEEFNRLREETEAYIRRQGEEATRWVESREAEMEGRMSEARAAIQTVLQERDEARREVESLKAELAALSAQVAPPPAGRAEVAMPGRKGR